MKNKAVYLALLVLSLLCVIFLSSCAIEPCNAGDLFIQSYTKNGVEYSGSSLINNYDFFGGFSPENVSVVFNEDKTCCLTLFGVEHNGSYVSTNTNRDTEFTITFEDNSIATGTIFRGAFDGVWIDCTITYNGETYEFSDDGEDDASDFAERKTERKAERMETEASSIEYSLVLADGIYQRVEDGEYVFYTRGEVVLENDTYYFIVSEETRYEIRTNEGFFYNYAEEAITSCDAIKEGTCVYKGDFENGYFAIFYAELEQVE